jgi:hypothetical protein
MYDHAEGMQHGCQYPNQWTCSSPRQDAGAEQRPCSGIKEVAHNSGKLIIGKLTQVCEIAEKTSLVWM